MADGESRGRTAADQIPLPGMEPGSGARQPNLVQRDDWIARLREALDEQRAGAPEIAEAALRACPGDPELLMLAALAALVAGAPERCLMYVKRYGKRYRSNKVGILLTALALGHQGHFMRARTMLEQNGLGNLPAASPWFVGDPGMSEWFIESFLRIRRESVRWELAAALSAKAARKPSVRTARRLPKARRAAAPPKAVAAAVAPPPIPDLPRLEARLETRCEFANAATIQVDGRHADPTWFRLRAEIVQLGLLQGFDELLCLPALRGVDTHWYQVETVRKVLKQFRGRVLLADEVGLGKTVEAGMVLKEYMLRGMAERVLILTPAALVGQWRDEMRSKFGIDCATSYDSLLRSDPAGFWAQPRVIASIALARRAEHAAVLARQSYDAVVVDEAHHLKNQNTANHRLVNGLQKRFLLLLSATPVQNDLLELYNLLTLLQPGIFKTPKDFRAAYMVPGRPREPANRDRLRDLMRGVMVRNTRALAALRLPRRHASTLRALPEDGERTCYRDLTTLARELAAAGEHPLAVQHLLGAAGSSPAAAAASIARFVQRHPEDARWRALLERYCANPTGAKETALLRLLAHNPAERKMVFVHHRDSLTHIAGMLHGHGLELAVFEGGMSGPDKDAAIEAFRDRVPLLLCSESGGEGRNLQFCNTLINFDIPWNPMAIEQRIGRIDRIGQTREVFVFNLVASGTVEEEVLRILDEKINMFELVVGEVGAILGELQEQQDFSTLVLDAWLNNTDDARRSAFAALGEQLLAARRQYQDARQLDEALFGEDFETS